MNTLFGLQNYGPKNGSTNGARTGATARVGAESAASIISSTDTRALALNTGIGSWIAALGPAARVTDTAFAASWAKWYADWIGFRNTFTAMPDLMQESDTMRSQAADYQKALFVWESRFEAQKTGKDTMAPTTLGSVTGGFSTWAWIPVLGGVAYGVWHFLLKGHWR